MNQYQVQPKEQELQDLTQNNYENASNQFAPYVNMQVYSQQQQYNQTAYNNNYAELNEGQDKKLENNFDNFKQYISNLQQNFSEESVGCQFFTICNTIVCFVILCVIIKSL
ncbi:unnamed protein product (macronuclear) [Paramecium tetraurelia]|uniref:Transmembrane protein n=1 Tax=Paramecium tetraurelia TaxID=5888 RepID=A0DLY1_PARTE|nr:uncharacterized protein GSPATT00018266001 [Paramecium tetraurelia]CAK84048.1 unnamed protein product [Paramecium tetraurelia]|eukprot:XP_001451445.1 hypothetical protein (macronuclear) [Paramecium tetraurelia strain d4-2]